MVRAPQPLLGSPQCIDRLVFGDFDGQALPSPLELPGKILEETGKCFGKNVVSTDSRPFQDAFLASRIVGLTPLNLWAPSGSTLGEEGLLYLGIHDVGDPFEAVPFRQERVLRVECL